MGPRIGRECTEEFEDGIGLTAFGVTVGPGCNCWTSLTRTMPLYRVFSYRVWCARGANHWFLVLMVVGMLVTRVSHAETVHAPAGAAPLQIPGDQVGCERVQGTWRLENGRQLRPPATAEIGEQSTVKVAPNYAECERNPQVLELVVIAPIPEIEPGSVVWNVGARRLEIQGRNLSGLRFRWTTEDRARVDVCAPITSPAAPEGAAAPGLERCAVAIDDHSDVMKQRFVWVPQGGYFGKEYHVYDGTGVILPQSRRELVPDRILVDKVFERERTVDVSRGRGRIELRYPEIVSGVECEGGHCELADQGVVVRGVPAATRQVVVTLRLQPRVSFVEKDHVSATHSKEFQVVRCDMTIVSGPPLRDVDSVKVLVRMPDACGTDAERLRWAINNADAIAEKVVMIGDQIYALLAATTRILDSRAVITASRPQDEGVLAFSSTPTLELSTVHTSLLLPGFGEVDFIPKNRSVRVATSTVSGGRWVPLEVRGAYTVDTDSNGTRVRGVYMSSGFTALRLGYRVDAVPAEFKNVNFATLIDPIQRPIREANLPIALGSSGFKERPIVELACAIKHGVVRRLEPGSTEHIPFAQRDSCRLLIHRSRIPKDAGEQLIEIDVSVTTAGDVVRGEAQMTERLLLRNGDDTEVVWIRGAKQQYDRIRVRVNHVVEEGRYLLGKGKAYRLPVSQWAIVTEDAFLKFYATATIPSGLYRFSNDPEDLGTGPLALNFGVLSRLTWLSEDGKESLVGLEGGVMSMGLASEKDRQLAIVGGLGIGVPLGNVNQPTQASLNIHAWVAYSLGKREGQLTGDDGSQTTIDLSPWAFIFGPSITIGSLAAFL